MKQTSNNDSSPQLSNIVTLESGRFKRLLRARRDANSPHERRREEAIGRLLEITHDVERQVRQLFAENDYWLISESTIRTVFCQSLAREARQEPMAGMMTPREICTEAAYGGATKIDLVSRVCGMDLVVEFKGWNVVPKYQEASGCCSASNASNAAVERQRRSIQKDVAGLLSIAPADARPRPLLRLIVVYYQHPIGAVPARSLLGRGPVTFSLMHLAEEDPSALLGTRRFRNLTQDLDPFPTGSEAHGTQTLFGMRFFLLDEPRAAGDVCVLRNPEGGE